MSQYPAGQSKIKVQPEHDFLSALLPIANDTINAKTCVIRAPRSTARWSTVLGHVYLINGQSASGGTRKPIGKTQSAFVNPLNCVKS